MSKVLFYRLAVDQPFVYDSTTFIKDNKQGGIQLGRAPDARRIKLGPLTMVEVAEDATLNPEITREDETVDLAIWFWKGMDEE